jgi:hypothetical protein
VDDLLARQSGGHLPEALDLLMTDDLFVSIEQSHTCLPLRLLVCAMR